MSLLSLFLLSFFTVAWASPVPLQPRAGEAADLVQLVDEKGLSFGLKVWIKFCTKRCYRKADDRAVELAAGIAANANGPQGEAGPDGNQDQAGPDGTVV
ncbi:hypothetical protein CBS147339_1307 [Penicillium roqueforti]|nr:hypothetical protein DTO012A8_7628 [Penicillium roqueforti]KAI3085057.1 hypothetical protein CBS147339_1307 [Penicillium roqueforti]KAI3153996.1 hypothetical protein CBS147325_1088 [Penicillium roqueforti]KAI3175721.1 hypothetical protein DTO046C5_2404 [Penicillium roqueforti]KAI3191549.1 hypothetical protein DTO032C6_1279 [Penicillium roqueforti]